MPDRCLSHELTAELSSQLTELAKSLNQLPELPIVRSSPVHPEKLPHEISFNLFEFFAQFLSFFLAVQ